MLRVKPGQEIRFPVEAKGRFKPLKIEGWLDKHTIGLNPNLLEPDIHDETGLGVILEGDKK